jgi:uncharacterized OB-fold protein
MRIRKSFSTKSRCDDDDDDDDDVDMDGQRGKILVIKKKNSGEVATPPAESCSFGTRPIIDQVRLDDASS